MTNIGVAHMEQFRTRENIRDEKLRITEGFAGGQGILFLNGDDDQLRSVQDRLPNTCVWYGLGDGCAYRGEEIRVRDGHTSFVLRHPNGTEHVRLPVTGAHHVYNALAAAAVADALGIPPADSIRGMRAYRGVALRQQIRKGNGVTVIDDSYNASPDSVRSGLDVLNALETDGRRIAVLADMYELGTYAETAHRDAGAAAVVCGVDELVAIGSMSGWIRDGAREAEGGERLPVRVFATLEEAYAYLKETVHPGDGLYVKGSRSMRCDRLARALADGIWVESDPVESDPDAPH